MTEPSAQEQTTTINNAPANVEVDTSVRELSITVGLHQNALLT